MSCCTTTLLFVLLGTILVRRSFANCLIAACSIVASQTIYVAIDGNDQTGSGLPSSPFRTIQHALTQSPLSTVQVGAGNFSTDSPVTISSMLGPISLVGSGNGTLFPCQMTVENSSIVIRDGSFQNCQSSSRSAALTVTSGSMVSLSDMLFLNNAYTVVAGTVGGGGAISSDVGSWLSLNSVTMIGNSITNPANCTAPLHKVYGGAVAADDLAIQSSVFRDNTVIYSCTLNCHSPPCGAGGAVSFYDSSGSMQDLSIDSSLFERNSVRFQSGTQASSFEGGAVSATYVISTNTVYQGNSIVSFGGTSQVFPVNANGGAIKTTVLDASNSSFISNTISSSDAKVVAWGGGVTVEQEMSLSDCVFRGNFLQAPAGTSMGGAISYSGSVKCTITSSLFMGNTVGDTLALAVNNTNNGYGAGLYIVGESLAASCTVTKSSFVANVNYNGDGGAVAIDSQNSLLQDCTFTQNSVYSPFQEVVTGSGVYLSQTAQSNTIERCRFVANTGVWVYDDVSGKNNFTNSEIVSFPTVYLSPDGSSDVNKCGSESVPCQNLVQASFLAGNGTTIYAAAGTYGCDELFGCTAHFLTGGVISIMGTSDTYFQCSSSDPAIRVTNVTTLSLFSANWKNCLTSSSSAIISITNGAVSLSGARVENISVCFLSAVQSDISMSHVSFVNSGFMSGLVIVDAPSFLNADNWNVTNSPIGTYIIASTGTIVLTNSTFAYNDGFLMQLNNGFATFNLCSFHHNALVMIQIVSAWTTFSQCDFYENHVQMTAIYVGSNGMVQMFNSTTYNNTATNTWISIEAQATVVINRSSFSNSVCKFLFSLFSSYATLELQESVVTGTQSGCVVVNLASECSFTSEGSTFADNLDSLIIATSSTSVGLYDSFFLRNVAVNSLCAIVTQGGLAIYNSQFINNVGKTCSVLLLQLNSESNNIIQLSYFSGNQAQYGSGSAVVLRSVAGIGIYSTVFDSNMAESSVDGGGAIGIFQSENVVISGCGFRANSGCYGGAIFVSGSQVGVQQSVFDGNSAVVAGGALYTTNTQLTVSSCNFTDNNANPGFGGAIFLADQISTELSNNTFSSNVAVDGGALFAMFCRQMEMSSNLWDSNVAQSMGGGLYLAFTQILIRDEKFHGNLAGSGGGMYSEHSGVGVAQSTFMKNIAVSLGGGIASTESVVTLTDVTATHNGAESAGVFYSDLSSNVTVANSNWYSNVAQYGGCAMISNSWMVFTNVTFNDNSGSMFGGVMKITSSGTVEMFQCTANGNMAYQSGGFASVGQLGTLYAESCVFTQHAANWRGGVVEIDDMAGRFTALGESCEFSNNKALEDGGGVAFSMFPDSTRISIDPRCVMKYNSAAYGPNIASSPYELQFATPSSISASTTEPYPEDVTVLLLDVYGQVVTDEGYQVQLVGPQGAQLKSTAPLINNIVDGSYTFQNHTVIFGVQPNSTTAVSFQVIPNLQTFTSLSLTVYSLPCSLGSGSFQSGCQTCPGGTFTTDPNQPCQVCPPGLQCLGKSDVFVLDSYWANPFEPTSTGVLSAYSCPFDFCTRSCDGRVCRGNNSVCTSFSGASAGSACVLDTTVMCPQDSHRQGVLCGECDADSAYWDNQCLECVSVRSMVSSSISRLVLITMQVTWSYVISQSESASAGFKLFIFLSQMTVLAMYPHSVSAVAHASGLRRFIQALADAESGLFHSHCPFPTSTYGGVIVQTLIPLVYLGFVPLVWLVHRLLARFMLWGSTSTYTEKHPRLRRAMNFLSVSPASTRVTRALIVVAIAQFQQLFLVMFSLLTCEPVLQVVTLVPSIHCQTTGYRLLNGLAIALIVILCVSLATVAIVLFVYRRRFGNLESLMPKYGVLIGEYRENVCWWEMYMLGRRVLLLAVFLPVVVSSPGLARALLVTLLLMFAGITLLVQPFKRGFNNSLEVFMLIALIVIATVNSNDDFDSIQQSTFSLVILAVTSIILFVPILSQLLVRARNLYYTAFAKHPGPLSNVSTSDSINLLPSSNDEELATAGDVSESTKLIPSEKSLSPFI